MVVAAANAAQAATTNRKRRVVQACMVVSFGKRRIERMRCACKLKRANGAFGVKKAEPNSSLMPLHPASR